MKIFFKLSIALLLPTLIIASGRDTTVINEVKVVSEYSKAIFPESWQVGSIDANGEQIAYDEQVRVEPIIEKALKKYPKDMLQMNLKAIYLIKSMKFYNVGFGGTNSTDAVYVTANGIDMGYTDSYIEQTVHHEFSSILFRNYPQFLDTVAWKKANIEGFDYNDPEAGVGAIRKNQSSQELDTILCTKGFLTQYAYSGLENDVNTLAQNLFRPDVNFWKLVDQFPRINTKVKLLIAFYNKINPLFTERYFRAFAKQ